jgi:hypothetical protein
MTWQPLTLTVRTPMFLGAANPPPDGTTIRFPVPSLRGALRYWLRTLAGAHLTQTPAGLTHLADIERAVFGAASTDQPGGDRPRRSASAIALRAVQPVPFKAPGRRPLWFDVENQTMPYLLGPGLWKSGTLAGYIPPGTSIPLDVRIDPRTPEPAACAHLFFASLWALQTFGGLGSRARRGWGTITTARPPDLAAATPDSAWWNPPPDHHVQLTLDAVLEQVHAAIRTLGVPVSDTTTPALAEYPCFRPEAYLISDVPTDDAGIPPEHTGLTGALDITSRLLRAFRSDEPDEYRDIVRPWLDGDHPDPALAFEIGALGLPVVYSDTDPTRHGRRTATVSPRLAGKEIRRASPLWLRIYPDQHNTWHLRSLAFLARWLPDQARLHLSGGRRGPQPISPHKPTQEQVNNLLKEWFPSS